MAYTIRCDSPFNGNCIFETNDGVTHYQQGKWDMIIAFPPCTYLTNSQNWCYNEKYGFKAELRKKERKKAIDFFKTIYNADCDKIVIENPVGYMNTHFHKPSQIIQPWQFGHPVTKTTCLWIKGLPLLIHYTDEKPKDMKSYARDNLIGKNGKILAWNSDEIKILRSKTFPGIAEAMAEQWG